MQSNRINKWLQNNYNGHRNQEIIVLVIQQNNPPHNLGDLQKIPDYGSNNFDLTILDNTLPYHPLKDSIVVTNGVQDQSLEKMKKILLKSVILVDNEQSIVKMIELLKFKTLDLQNEIEYALVEKIDLEEVLKQDIQSLKEYVTLRHHYIQKLNRYLIMIDDTLINHYWNLYEQKNILLASFAQALYRLASLNFIANDKVIGGELRKVLGIKSSVMCFKSLSPSLPIRLKKNHRVYDLNENPSETKLKLTIAKKLLLLNSKDLDVQKISKILDLPQKQIEKMYSKYILK